MLAPVLIQVCQVIISVEVRPFGYSGQGQYPSSLARAIPRDNSRPAHYLQHSRASAVAKAQQRWKNEKWSNPDDEKRAINRALEMIQRYKDYLQRKRITSYKFDEVRKYEKKMRKRLAVLKRKG